jgi:pimeloyl-ACP methyl ester carboxylesterase
MRRVYRWLVALLAIITLSACGGAPAAGQLAVASLGLAPCQLAAPGSAEHIAARCAILTVFEDRAAQSGRTIDLHIAVVPALSRSPAPDPLFLLAGGPGQAASETYPLLAGAFAPLNQKRDIVLVDQRGTGLSRALRCPPAKSTLEIPSAAQLAASLSSCLASLDADPKLYTTAIAMDDLDQVRAALGYERINLYGVSYGTRAALTYMRQHPDRVRSAILDGVVPQDQALGLNVARDAQRALNLIFDRCAGDYVCKCAFPDARGEFAALLERLARQPARVSLPHPTSGAATELIFDRDELAASVRLLSYAPETAALLPLLIHTVHDSGDYRLLAAQALMAGDQLNGSISSGMNFSVLCAEDLPFLDQARAAQANAGAYLGDTEIDKLRAICGLWPRGAVPADFKQPVASSAPALLLSGEDDPVTPPDNADQAAKTLPNSLRLVAPGQGHIVIMRGCIPRIAADFVERGTVAGLSTDCVGDIRPAPFFTSFTGPQP